MHGNTVSIKGNLTRDAEQRCTSSGKLALEWGIAWNSSRMNPQTTQYEDVPHYFDCIAWVTPNQLNVIAPQLVKGAGCAIIDGSLVYSQWQANDGSNRSKVRIKVDDPISGMQITPPRGGQRRAPQEYEQAPNSPTVQTYGQQPYIQGEQGYTQQAPQQAASYYDEDIPF